MISNGNVRLFRWICMLAFVVSGLLGSMSAVHASQSITLGWDLDADPQITGYRLYYGTASGSYTQSLDVGDLNTVTLLSLAGGNTYYAVVTSYNTAGAESLPSDEVSFNVATNSVPMVSLASPGSTINGPATITLSASASADNASIIRVEFYAGSSKLGVATTAPYSVVWNSAQPGNYNLSAVAYDSNNVSASSDVVPVNIVSFGVTNLERTSNGNYQFTVTGAPGSTCSIYISEDLVNWRLWEAVTNDNGTVRVSDETANQVPRRFYKLVSSSGTQTSGMQGSGIAPRTNARVRR